MNSSPDERSRRAVVYIFRIRIDDRMLNERVKNNCFLIVKFVFSIFFIVVLRVDMAKRNPLTRSGIYYSIYCNDLGASVCINVIGSHVFGRPRLWPNRVHVRAVNSG